MASALPEDIVMEILAALDVPDLVRAGSVCSAWHGAYTSICSLGRWRQPQTPCLLYTAKSRGESAAGLYSLSDKKPYTLAALPDPPIRSRHVIGSACGWIITADERSELHLLNPITGDQIALPSVTTFEYVEPIYDKNGAVKEYSSWYPLPGPYGPWTYSLRKLRETFFEKAFLSSDPCTGDYIVAVIHSPCFRLSFARSGDDHWTLLPHDFFEDCVFKDGLMYAVTRLGSIVVFDFSGPAVEQKIVLGEMRNHGFEGALALVASSSTRSPCFLSTSATRRRGVGAEPRSRGRPEARRTPQQQDADADREHQRAGGRRRRRRHPQGLLQGGRQDHRQARILRHGVDKRVGAHVVRGERGAGGVRRARLHRRHRPRRQREAQRGRCRDPRDQALGQQVQILHQIRRCAETQLWLQRIDFLK